MAMTKCLIFLLIAVALHLVHADDGTATYYTPPYNPSACFGNVDEGTNIAAASEAIWEDGNACGRIYKVTCTGYVYDNDFYPCKEGTSVTVKIVDLCPKPVCDGTIDLSQEAFETIAKLDGQKVQIAYERIS